MEEKVNNLDFTNATKPSKLTRFLAAAALLHSSLLLEPIRQSAAAIIDQVHAALDPDFATQQKVEELEDLRPKDPEAERQFKAELIQKLENHEPISLEYFTFQSEQVSLGMTQAEAAEARTILHDILEKLKATKPSTPTLEFLQEIRNTVPPEQQPAPLLRSVIRFLRRMNKPRRGSCVPAAIYFAIVLQELYPERSNDIYFQVLGKDINRKYDHIRTLFKTPSENVFYVLDINFPEVQIISPEETEGTALYGIQDHIGAYTGDPRFIKVIEVNKTNPEESQTNADKFEGNMAGPIIKGTLKPYVLPPNPLAPPETKTEAELLKEDIARERAEIEEAKIAGNTFDVEVFPQYNNYEIKKDAEGRTIVHPFFEFQGLPKPEIYAYLDKNTEEALQEGKSYAEGVFEIYNHPNLQMIQTINTYQGKLPIGHFIKTTLLIYPMIHW